MSPVRSVTYVSGTDTAMMVARDGVEPPTPAFSGKNESDYNNFVARVALEVVDGALWKQQLRVTNAGSGTSALSSSHKGHGGSRHSPSVTTLTGNTKEVNKIKRQIAFRRLDADWGTPQSH